MLKMGRTQLQDAVPMTLGQEFAPSPSRSARTSDRLARSRSADPRNQHGRARRSAPA